LYDILSTTAVIIVTLTSYGILVVNQWRISFILLLVQYPAIFIILTRTWSIQMAASILISGIIACIVLTMAIINQSEAHDDGYHFRFSIAALKTNTHRKDKPLSETNLLFNIFAGLLVCLLVFSLSGSIEMQDMNNLDIWSTLILICLGLLKVSLTQQTYQTMVGLLTALSGFEIFYASIDTAIATAGMLAAINLGLGIVGAYLVSTAFMDEIK
jgi:hypothetical protein